MNVTKAVVFAVSLALMGCATTGEQQAVRQRNVHTLCHNAGFIPGQEGYGACVMQAYGEDAAVDQARRATALQAGILLLGISRPPPPPMPVTCVRRSSNGSIVICQ